VAHFHRDLGAPDDHALQVVGVERRMRGLEAHERVHDLLVVAVHGVRLVSGGLERADVEVGDDLLRIGGREKALK